MINIFVCHIEKCISYFRVICLFSMICASSLIKDKEEGTLQRSRACGVELWHIYVSYYLSESPTTLAQIGIYFMSYLLLGGYTNKGFFWLCFLTAVLSGWVGIAIGKVPIFGKD